MVVRRSYRPLDLPIGVTLDEGAIGSIDRVLGRFGAGGPGCSPSFELTRGAGGECLVLRGEELVAREASWDAAVDALVTVVNGAAIAAFEGFAVHAGVIGVEAGAIAFPNVSGAGKSTLTAACLQAGARYVSDEALCIDFTNGMVLPYPKPIRLSAASQRLLGLSPLRATDVLVSADELGAATVDAPLPLVHVVQLVRTDDAPSLVAVPRSTGLADLLRFSFNHYKRPRAAFELAGRLAARACAWRLEYSSPAAAAELLLSRLGEREG